MIVCLRKLGWVVEVTMIFLMRLVSESMRFMAFSRENGCESREFTSSLSSSNDKQAKGDTNVEGRLGKSF